MIESEKQAKIESFLTRGVENIVPNKEEVRKQLSSGKVLNVYLGIDPTATKIHLGHAFPLRKLQILADLGHNVTFLIGDGTALVGDTSDKDGERPILSREQIE
ncbi:MAG TPA: tyrosine--tRNA ligase, partial [Spirochaetia bacterium]|nr:tyrosine--tRNA ligase [Spirochaetia bacterium]